MYMLKCFVILIAFLKPTNAHPCVCVTATRLNIRSCGSTSCKVLGTEPNGACFKHLQNVANGWEKIQYGGQVAYASGRYLTHPCDAPFVRVKTSGGRLNVRSCASKSCAILGKATNGQCLKWKKTSGSWEQVLYNNKVAFGYGTYLSNVESCGTSTPTTTTHKNTDVDFVSRNKWNARSPKRTTALNTPVNTVFIHHTAGTRCSSQQTCESTVRAIQNYHIYTKGWWDIGYSFLVGEDDRIYEGRGWDVVGAHTSGYNSGAYGVSVMGDFTNTLPNQSTLTAIKNFIAYGVQEGKITANYQLSGHRDAASTTCPGNKLYAEIRTWPHYTASP